MEKDSKPILKRVPPLMTDESGKAHRAKYIALGLLKPSDTVYAPYERPPMLASQVQELKKKYIRAGLLLPRGWH